MTNYRKILISGAFASLIALPVLAIDLAADAAHGLTVSMPMAEGTVSVAETMRADNPFIGNEVRTKDQIVIGTVDRVSVDENGVQKIYVVLSSDTFSQTEIKEFSVLVPKDITSDGSVTLGWNESELLIALGDQMKSE